MREMIGHVDFKVCFHQFYSHMAYRHASPPLPSVNVVLAVEIKCMGHPVLPSLQVQNLVDSWLDMAASGHRIPATIGSSGKDFVMILTYGRKVLHP
ncbi:hypothetical protein JHK85_027422 [Glycine max]|nr:hypothetical protein JHK85_027422 [Glycine max]